MQECGNAVNQLSGNNNHKIKQYVTDKFETRSHS